MQEKIAKLVAEIRAQAPETSSKDIARVIAPDLGIDADDDIDALATEIDGFEVLKKKDPTEEPQPPMEQPTGSNASASSLGSSIPSEKEPPKEETEKERYERIANEKLSAILSMDNPEDVTNAVKDFRFSYGTTLDIDYGKLEESAIERAEENKKLNQRVDGRLRETAVFSNKKGDLEKALEEQGIPEENRQQYIDIFEQSADYRAKNGDAFDEKYVQAMAEAGYINSGRASRIRANIARENQEFNNMVSSVNTTFNSEGYDVAMDQLETYLSKRRGSKGKKNALRSQIQSTYAYAEAENQVESALGRLGEEELQSLAVQVSKRTGEPLDVVIDRLRGHMEKQDPIEYVSQFAYAQFTIPDFATEEINAQGQLDIAERQFTSEESFIKENDRPDTDAELASYYEAEQALGLAKANLAMVRVQRNEMQSFATNPDNADALRVANLYRAAARIVTAEEASKEKGIGSFYDVFTKTPVEVYRRSEKGQAYLARNPNATEQEIAIRANNFVDKMLKDRAVELREYIIGAAKDAGISEDKFGEIEAQLRDGLGITIDLTGDGGTGYYANMFGMNSGIAMLNPAIAAAMNSRVAQDFLNRPLSSFLSSVSDMAVGFVNVVKDAVGGSPTVKELEVRFSEESYTQRNRGRFVQYEWGGSSYATAVETIDMVSASAPSTLAAVGTTILTRNPNAGMAIVGALEASNIYNEYRKTSEFYGISGLEATSRIAVGAVTAAATERIFGDIRMAKQVLGNTFTRAIAENPISFVTRMATQLGINATAETIGEAITFAAQSAMQSGMTGEYDWTEPEHLIPALEKIAATSVVMSTGMGSVSIAANNINRKIALADLDFNLNSIVSNTESNSPERTAALNQFFSELRGVSSILRNEADFVEFVRSVNPADVALINSYQNVISSIQAGLNSSMTLEESKEKMAEAVRAIRLIEDKYAAPFAVSMDGKALDTAIESVDAQIKTQRNIISRLRKRKGNESEIESANKEVSRLRDKLAALRVERSKKISNLDGEVQLTGVFSGQLDTQRAFAMRARGYRVVSTDTETGQSFVIYDRRGKVKIDESLPLEQRQRDAVFQAKREYERAEGKSRASVEASMIDVLVNRVMNEGTAGLTPSERKFYQTPRIRSSVDAAVAERTSVDLARLDETRANIESAPEMQDVTEDNLSELSEVLNERQAKMLFNFAKKLGFSVKFSKDKNSIYKGIEDDNVIYSVANGGEIKAKYNRDTRTISVVEGATFKDVVEEMVHALLTPDGSGNDTRAKMAVMLRLKQLFLRDERTASIMRRKRALYSDIGFSESSLINEEVSEVISAMIESNDINQKRSVVTVIIDRIKSLFSVGGDDLNTLIQDDKTVNRILKVFSDGIIENKGFNRDEVNSILDIQDEGVNVEVDTDVESTADIYLHDMQIRSLISPFVTRREDGRLMSEDIDSFMAQNGLDAASVKAEGIIPYTEAHYLKVYEYAFENSGGDLFAYKVKGMDVESKELFEGVNELFDKKPEGWKEEVTSLLMENGVKKESIDRLFSKQGYAPTIISDIVRGELYKKQYRFKGPIKINETTKLKDIQEKTNKIATNLADEIMSQVGESLKTGKNESLLFVEDAQKGTERWLDNKNIDGSVAIKGGLERYFGGSDGLTWAKNNKNLYYLILSITSNGNTAEPNVILSKYIFMSLARMQSENKGVNLFEHDQIDGLVSKISASPIIPGLVGNPGRAKSISLQLKKAFTELNKRHQERYADQSKNNDFDDLLKDLSERRKVLTPRHAYSKMKEYTELMDIVSEKIGAWASNLMGNEMAVTQDAHFVQMLELFKGVAPTLVSKGSKKLDDNIKKVPSSKYERVINELITVKAAKKLTEKLDMKISPAVVQQLMFQINHEQRAALNTPNSSYEEYGTHIGGVRTFSKEPIYNDYEYDKKATTRKTGENEWTQDVGEYTTRRAISMFDKKVSEEVLLKRIDTISKMSETSSAKAEKIADVFKDYNDQLAWNKKKKSVNGMELFSFSPGQPRLHGPGDLMVNGGDFVTELNIDEILKPYPLHSAIRAQDIALKDNQKVYVSVDRRILTDTFSSVLNVSKTVSGMPFHVTDSVVMSKVSFPKPGRFSLDDIRNNKVPKSHISGNVKKDFDPVESMTGVIVRMDPLTSNAFIDELGRPIKSADEVTVSNGAVIARGNIEYYPMSMVTNGMFEDKPFPPSIRNMSESKMEDVVAKMKSVLAKYFPESYTDEVEDLLNMFSMMTPENQEAVMQEKLTPQGRLRKTASRAAKFEEFSDLKDDITENPQNYIEPKYTSKSKEELADMSVQELVSMMRSDKLGSLINRNDDISVLAGIELINRMQAEGRTEAIPGLLEDLAKMGTTVGRLLRQFGELKSSTSYGIYSMVMSMVDKQGRTLNDDQKSRLQQAADKYMDAYRAYESLMDRAIAGKTLESELKAAMDEYLKAQSELDTLVNKFVDKNWSDIGVQLIQGNLLTSMSQAKNIAYNIAQLIPRTMVDIGSYPIEKLLSLTGLNTSERKLGFMAYVYGLRKFGAGWVEALEQVATGRQKEITEWRMDRGFMPVRSLIAALSSDLPATKSGRASLNSRAKLLVAGTFGIPAETMFRLLSLGDIPFRRYAEGTELYQIGLARGLKGDDLARFLKYPPADALNKAKDEGARMTFQKEGGFAKGSMWIINNMSRGLGKMFDNNKGFDASGFFKFFIRSNVPYVSTIANFMEESLTYISPAFGTAKVAANIMNKDGEQAAKNMTKVVIGQVFTQGTLYMIANGILSSSVDWRDDEKTNIMYDVMPPNSINISALKRLLRGEDAMPQANDVYKSYQTLGILGSIMGAYAKSMTKEAAQDAIQNPTSGINVMKRVLGMENLSLISYMMDQSFMQGLSGFLDVITEADPEKMEKAMEKYTENMAKVYSAMVLPNFLSGLNMATREFLPDKRSADLGERIFNHVKERTFNVDGLAVKVNWKGERISQTPTGGSQFSYYMFDPYKTSTTGEDPVSLEILRLYHTLGTLPKAVGTPYYASSLTRKIETPSFKRGPAKKAIAALKANGVVYSFVSEAPDDFYVLFTTHEINEVLQRSNSARFASISAMMKTQAYNDASDQEKVEMLDEIYNGFNSILDYNEDGTLKAHSRYILDIMQERWDQQKNDELWIQMLNEQMMNEERKNK